jgi:sugar-specific transcriptional regulator TrmB
MQEDIIFKLTNFGFTVNQAKVYLSIVNSGSTHVGKISKETMLHRQDIYKILPKLEKMGLITKTIDKPFRIKAVSVERALDNLISRERKKADDKISYLEISLSELMLSLQEQPEKMKNQALLFLLMMMQ